MFDFDAIERALDAAATCGFDEARAEFAKLRKAMESATEPQRVPLDCIVHVTVSESWRGDRVLLVKADG